MTPTRAYWRGRHVVYRSYDETDRLLYVGRTRDVVGRIAEHRGQMWWWRLLTTRVRVQVFPTLEAASAAERIAIQEETPVFNQMGVKNWRDRPHWSARDHDLYENWYRGQVSRFPVHVQKNLLESMFSGSSIRAVR